MNAEYRRYLIFLLFVTAIVLTAGLGLRDPWPADEPRFALIARDMVASGNWLFPHVGGEIYPDKPPLFFWLVAVLYALTDSLRLAFLVPGILAGLGTMLLVTDLARRLWGPKNRYLVWRIVAGHCPVSAADENPGRSTLYFASGRHSASTGSADICCLARTGAGM